MFDIDLLHPFWSVIKQARLLWIKFPWGSSMHCMVNVVRLVKDNRNYISIFLNYVMYFSFNGNSLNIFILWYGAVQFGQFILFNIIFTWSSKFVSIFRNLPDLISCFDGIMECTFDAPETINGYENMGEFMCNDTNSKSCCLLAGYGLLSIRPCLLTLRLQKREVQPVPTRFIQFLRIEPERLMNSSFTYVLPILTFCSIHI